MASPFIKVPLQGRPGKRLLDAWEAMDPSMQQAFHPHLVGDTPAEVLAYWLERNGTPVSASTIRTYRRSLKRRGV